MVSFVLWLVAMSQSSQYTSPIDTLLGLWYISQDHSTPRGRELAQLLAECHGEAGVGGWTSLLPSVYVLAIDVLEAVTIEIPVVICCVVGRCVCGLLGPGLCSVPEYSSLWL